jgi:hypothetical protein
LENSVTVSRPKRSRQLWTDLFCLPCEKKQSGCFSLPAPCLPPGVRMMTPMPPKIIHIITADIEVEDKTSPTHRRHRASSDFNLQAKEGSRSITPRSQLDRRRRFHFGLAPPQTRRLKAVQLLSRPKKGAISLENRSPSLTVLVVRAFSSCVERMTGAADDASLRGVFHWPAQSAAAAQKECDHGWVRRIDDSRSTSFQSDRVL